MAGTDAPRDAMQAAYKAWRAATDEYDDRIKSIIRGEPHDRAAMQLNIDAMDRTRHAFMVASEPFVTWKS